MPVMLTHQQQDEVQVSFAVTASAAAFTVFTGSIYQFGLQNASTTQAIIPATEVWHLIAMKVNGSALGDGTTTGVDAQVLYYQNGYVQDFKPFLGSLLTTNNYSPYEFDESQPMYPTNNFQISIVLSTAAPATAYTQNMVLRFQRAPFTG